VGNLAQMRELIGELPNIRLVVYDSRGHGYTSGVGDPKKIELLRDGRRYACASRQAETSRRLFFPCGSFRPPCPSNLLTSCKASSCLPWSSGIIKILCICSDTLEA